MHRIKIALSVLYFLLFSYSALSLEGVFVDGLSEKIDNKDLIRATKQAFISRQWTITDESEVSVTGTIDHRGVNATLTIFKSDNTLRFICTGTRENEHTRTLPNGHQTKVANHVKDYCPKMWVRNLEKDFRLILKWEIKSDDGPI